MSETLPINAVARANGKARRDGAFAGLTAGLLGAIIGSRLGLSRTNTFIAGTISGILSGYQFTQGFAAANMSRLRAEVAAAAQEANRWHPICQRTFVAIYGSGLGSRTRLPFPMEAREEMV
ncbi:hypothetical protein BGY98DRAFT_929790 [Russula aff. rugulosa BPL654]|nr:hypothetical protein BGY98DRAFT_929790 [Russula aff. rugulosa BPL654]